MSFSQNPSSNIPNMCLQEADGTHCTWSSDDRLLLNTIFLWERCYCAEILQSFAGGFLMVETLIVLRGLFNSIVARGMLMRAHK